jgi:hypothetical protein
MKRKNHRQLGPKKIVNALYVSGVLRKVVLVDCRGLFCPKTNNEPVHTYSKFIFVMMN